MTSSITITLLLLMVFIDASSWVYKKVVFIGSENLEVTKPLLLKERAGFHISSLSLSLLSLSLLSLSLSSLSLSLSLLLSSL